MILLNRKEFSEAQTFPKLATRAEQRYIAALRYRLHVLLVKTQDAPKGKCVWQKQEISALEYALRVVEDAIEKRPQVTGHFEFRAL